jgi:ribosomal protein S18 acetylase RimI-like enzyme
MTVARTEEAPAGAVARLTADMPAGLRVRMLTEQEWHVLRDVRLIALKDSPESFLSNYDQEVDYDERRWRAEFNRGDWMIASRQGATVGFLGATRYMDIPSTDRYLEYLWVSPISRRSGVASIIIRAVLGHLGAEGVAAVWLWILDGNMPALQLYKKFGFISTKERQQVSESSSRCEEKMKLILPLVSSYSA